MAVRTLSPIFTVDTSAPTLSDCRANIGYSAVCSSVRRLKHEVHSKRETDGTLYSWKPTAPPDVSGAATLIMQFH